MKLPKKVKAKWLAALRSGEYKQATETMYNPETKGFCCLGVLEHCMLNGEVEKNYIHPDGCYLIGEFASFPSKKFWDNIGMVPSYDGEFLTHDIGPKKAMYTGSLISGLAGMNDDRISFAEIADYIECEVEAY